MQSPEVNMSAIDNEVTFSKHNALRSSKLQKEGFESFL